MRVIAGIFVALGALLSSVTARCQVAAADTPEEPKAVQIVLYPAAEPSPALKYQLLPPFLERRPGNAAVMWNRIPIMNDVFFREFEKEHDMEPGRIYIWMQLPIGSPQEKEYRNKELEKVVYLLRPKSIFRDMERAARYESCDWQMPIREGNFALISLPEIQHSRAYARFLSAKAHLEIAEGKYDLALRTLQTGYAEARQVGQGPTLVNGLVGITLASVMSNEVREFIQQPGAPNLYWALSTLPRPMIDWQPGAEAESNILYLQFPELRGLDKKSLSPDEWRALLMKVIHGIQQLFAFESSPPSPNAYATTIAMATLEGYPRAKRYLIEKGRTAAEVEAMPVAQVILLYTVQTYDEVSDDQFKWFFLPADETRERMERAEQHRKEALAARPDIIPVARFLLPTISVARAAETRCQWTLAMLRIFEAMRLYAATHDGQWPDRLSDITEVPIPTNPFDGKSFVYERQGDKAILTSENGPRGMAWRHEITLMPKAK